MRNAIAVAIPWVENSPATGLIAQKEKCLQDMQAALKSCEGEG